MAAIAEAAGVTRPTVYAHFRTRDELVAAVVERLTGEFVAALDAADLDAPPAAEALRRFLDVSAGLFGGRPALIRPEALPPVSAEQDRERHTPVAERLERIIRRGQQGGEFPADVPPGWIADAIIALGHAAGTEAADGLAPAQARKALHAAALRLAGADRT